MENSYLIPANTKKSQYILGFFTLTDLIIVIVGCTWTLLTMLFVSHKTLPIIILALLPGLIAAFLVMPVPHYHNILQLLTNIFTFFFGRRRYYWKGWSIYEELETNNRK